MDRQTESSARTPTEPELMTLEQVWAWIDALPSKALPYFATAAVFALAFTATYFIVTR